MKYFLKFTLILGLIGLLFSITTTESIAQIPINSYTDSNVGGPTFNRPTLSPLPTTSGIITPYHVKGMRVTCTGTYHIGVSQDFNGTVAVYKDMFFPTRPLLNLIAFNDDAIPSDPFLSEVGVALEAGTDYFIVVSGSSPTETGAFTTIAVKSVLSFGCDIIFFDLTLPISLVSFEARNLENHVKLDWVTAAEENNKGFEIEMAKAKNGEDLRFEMVGSLEGNGTTAKTNNYTYKVDNLEKGTYYFRLKQLDYDGSFSYSEVVVVEFMPKASEATANVYPNPIGFHSVIDIKVASEERIVVDIRSVDGRLIERLFDATIGEYDTPKIELSEAYNRISAKGVYFISVRGEAWQKTIPFSIN